VSESLQTIIIIIIIIIIIMLMKIKSCYWSTKCAQEFDWYNINFHTFAEFTLV